MSIRLQFIYHGYKAFSIVIGFVLCVGLPFYEHKQPFEWTQCGVNCLLSNDILWGTDMDDK